MDINLLKKRVDVLEDELRIAKKKLEHIENILISTGISEGFVSADYYLKKKL